jgi:chemotaxis protein methyltransferase CheR/two-component system CheB/CheR fusion protein
MIVGIGASAGGLEAIEAFLSHVPLPCGLAFIVVQHLDPTHKGILPELLQRTTTMKVTQIRSRMKVKADCVYVIPPNKDLSILHGVLYLLDPVKTQGLRLPIDFFLRSLADDQRERAIGVILSGMGNDGTLGLGAIKKNAGIAVAQEPNSAKFDSMPRSVIDSGIIDIIGQAQELPQRIVDYINHIPSSLTMSYTNSESLLPLKTKSALEQIVILLRDRSGNDFSLYKNNTILRRIERRMGLHKVIEINEYIHYLQENPHELDLLFKELLIGVTNFFRDQLLWEYLKNELFPALFAANPSGKSLRAWVPACSSGEEAYSLAIVFKEALLQSQSQAEFSLQIFATDLDQDAIDKARRGFYPANINTDVSAECLNHFFIAEEGGYRINKTIREMVIFAQQNIIMNPPFTKLDLLTCRNLLIYLGAELQRKLIPLFHYALTSQGILVLGNAETIGAFMHLFHPVDSKLRVYRRIDNTLPVSTVNFPIKYFPLASQEKTDTRSIYPMVCPPSNLEKVTEQLLLQHYTPAAVLIDANGDILYISGRTGKYLEPAAGKANMNIHAMAREGLKQELAIALNKAQQQIEPVHIPGIIVGANGGSQMINLTVQAIEKPEAIRDTFLLVFNDISNPASGKRRRKAPDGGRNEFEMQLRQALDELENTRAQMQSSQEELKSANEELQSTNEELQSANEELTTSKEEMQSLNEELQSVNAELQSKVDDLTWVNNDMTNLLNSMEIATIFLDNSLCIRRFTTHSTQLFKLIPSDVGRPLSDIVTDLNYPQLMQDVEQVLNTLVFQDKQVTTQDGRWFKVRIMPYRTQDNMIDGVAMTFIDITETKMLEAELRGMVT